MNTMIFKRFFLGFFSLFMLVGTAPLLAEGGKLKPTAFQKAKPNTPARMEQKVQKAQARLIQARQQEANPGVMNVNGLRQQTRSARINLQNKLDAQHKVAMKPKVVRSTTVTMGGARANATPKKATVVRPRAPSIRK